MAEFCLDCWNEINESHDSKWRFVMSWNHELCEECGQLKRVIVSEHLWSRWHRTLTELIENLGRE